MSVNATAFAITTATFAAYILAFGLVRTVALPVLFQDPFDFPYVPTFSTSVRHGAAFGALYIESVIAL